MDFLEGLVQTADALAPLIAPISLALSLLALYLTHSRSEHSKAVEAQRMLSEAEQEFQRAADQPVQNRAVLLQELANVRRMVERASLTLPKVDRPRADVVYAACLGLEGKFAQAESALRKLSERHPDLHQAPCQLAALYVRHKKWPEAEEAAKRAIEIDSNCSTAHSNLAKTFFDRGRFDDAIAVYRRQLEGSPGDPSVLANLGSAQADSGDSEAAIASFTEAIKRGRRDAHVYRNLGKVYGRDGHAHEALRMFELAVAQDPTDAESLVIAGVIYEDLLKDLEKAAERYRSALAFDPENPVAKESLQRIVSGD